LFGRVVVTAVFSSEILPVVSVFQLSNTPNLPNAESILYAKEPLTVLSN
jgi:hypothetical protein